METVPVSGARIVAAVRMVAAALAAAPTGLPVSVDALARGTALALGTDPELVVDACAIAELY